MSKVYKHGTNTEPAVQCEEIRIDRPLSILTNPGNVFNDRLIYDIPSCAFKPSNNPIDDRITKNSMIVDWIKRLDTHLLTKYSYECFKDIQEMEIYQFLSSLIQAREAVNFLTVYTTTKNAIYTEYYSSIRDIYTFLRDAGEERYTCMIQMAAILMTLHKHGFIPINPTWGFIRTPKVEINYGFASQLYTVKVEHIMVLQSSTKFLRQQESISDMTYYNLFAASVGLRPGKYSSIIEWLIINCGSFTKPLKKTIKPPYTMPLTTQSPGSIVFVENQNDNMRGILLSNNFSSFCSIMFTEGTNSYIEPSVAKALVTVAPPTINLGNNVITVC